MSMTLQIVAENRIKLFLLTFLNDVCWYNC